MFFFLQTDVTAITRTYSVCVTASGERVSRVVGEDGVVNILVMGGGGGGGGVKKIAGKTGDGDGPKTFGDSNENVPHPNTQKLITNDTSFTSAAIL